jgi:hypothetical protein
MGPNFWRHPTSGLQKGSERSRTSCDEHQDCCAVTACSYCLELELYGAEIVHGFATQDNSQWTGTVDGHDFAAFWDRDYETGECGFVVEFDGVEVYRKTCYEGQSCRDSSDETAVDLGYDTATLRWKRYEPIPLPHVTDAETGCKTWFCDDCELTCDTICVTVNTQYFETTKGELDNSAYACDPPFWRGRIAGYDLEIALDRDRYGYCVIRPTVDGVEQATVRAPGCNNMAASFELEDGTEIVVTCKVCDCQQTTGECCHPRCAPLKILPAGGEVPGTCDNPLPLTLQCDLTATASDGIATCFNGSGTLTYKTAATGGVNCWEGILSGTCTDCYGATLTWSVKVVVCCSDGIHTASMINTGAGMPCPATTVTPATTGLTVCDPFMISGCFDPFAGCWTGCLVDVTLIPSPTFTVCYSIYELP